MIPIPRRSAARASASAALCGGMLAVTLALGGCTPGTDPKPTPTPLFTSEADAYKAAEKVYREYVDAGNAEQNGDSEANPQQHLAGTALEDDIQSGRDFSAAGLRIAGQSTIEKYASKSFNPQSSVVDAFVCLDVSKSRVLNGNGQDVTPVSRAPFVGIAVKLAPDATSYKIVKLAPSTDPCP